MNGPTLEQLRSRFPALDSGFAFLENAGGSQVPRDVIERVSDYMAKSYVQVGATYPQSEQASQAVREAHEFCQTLLGGDENYVAILGPSTSQLLRVLSDGYAEVWRPGDEIIIARSNHESNIAPWIRLQDRGIVIKWWEIDADTWQLQAADLEPLLSARTKLVAFPHVSNILGVVNDVEAITSAAHRAGARVAVDGVAYASHRVPKVSDWKADYYSYSCYKVFGPHLAAMASNRNALAELRGPNHYFIGNKDLPYKFELGGVCHEGCAGLLGSQSYFQFLANSGETFDRAIIAKAYERISELEAPLVKQLLDSLRALPVRILGPASYSPDRVGTVSFVHSAQSSASIVAEVVKHPIGIRNGCMYSNRLCESYGIDTEDGVVRVSLLHYNSAKEIEKFCSVLTEVLR